MNNHPCRRFRFLFPLGILVIVGAASGVVYGLWNGVLVDVLGVKVISYWQALGLLILAKILFGGFPGRRCGGFGPPWKHRMMMEHWQSLTPEQREQMRDEMRRRFGDWPRPPCCDDEAKPGSGPTA